MSDWNAAIKAAAKVCRERADVHAKAVTYATTFIRTKELEAIECERDILALAEQEDQRGAVPRGFPEHRFGEFDAERRRAYDQAQSAPHHNPAGQVADDGKGAPDARAPALPGPMVSVPREPTEAMIDAPRQIILYAETRGRTLEGLREHLDLAGVEFHSWFPEWAITERGHLTKAAIAILVYRAMLAAGSGK